MVALKVTSNINGLIKDLFHNPPSYKCVINLSWRPIVSMRAHFVEGILEAIQTETEISSDRNVIKNQNFDQCLSLDASICLNEVFCIMPQAELLRKVSPKILNKTKFNGFNVPI